MLKLKLQYFFYLMGRTDSLESAWCWERLKAGGEGDDTGWDGLMVSLTRWTWDWANSGSWWLTGKPGMLQSMELQRVGHDWASEQLSVILVVAWRMVLRFIASIPFHVCETLHDPMVCSPPGSSVHGISQARILEWVAIFPSPGDLLDPWIKLVFPLSLALAGRFSTTEPLGKPN